MKDTCAGLSDRHFVNDYERDITSIEEAKEIFREVANEKFKNYPNQTLAQMEIEKSLDNTRQWEDKYIISFYVNCYELRSNGKLYSYWCGD